MTNIPFFDFALFYGFFFILGAIFGSFACCQAWRIHERLNQRSLGARSICLNCHHRLAWYDNLPIFSWLALRGRCRYCRQFKLFHLLSSRFSHRRKLPASHSYPFFHPPRFVRAFLDFTHLRCKVGRIAHLSHDVTNSSRPRFSSHHHRKTRPSPANFSYRTSCWTLLFTLLFQPRKISWWWRLVALYFYRYFSWSPRVCSF